MKDDIKTKNESEKDKVSIEIINNNNFPNYKSDINPLKSLKSNPQKKLNKFFIVAKKNK